MALGCAAVSAGSSSNVHYTSPTCVRLAQLLPLFLHVVAPPLTHPMLHPQHKLLPSRQLDTRLLHAESTAVQRTVTTLRGVLSGLYPNSTARVVRVAVRPYAEETMTADRQGCAVLGNLTQRLADEQKAQGTCVLVSRQGAHACKHGAGQDTPGKAVGGSACWL
jgi:hypothetical protein